MMDETKYTIRLFRESDYTPENPLTVEAWREIFDGYRSQLGDALFHRFYDGWEQRKYNEFHSSMVNNGKENHAFTIEAADGTVAAMGSFASRGGCGIVCSNAVRPELRGEGIGAALHRRLLSSMREEGLRFASVGTGGDDAHAPARRSYERSGFAHPVPHVTCFRDNRTAPTPDALPDGVVIRRPDKSDYAAIASLAVRAWEPVWTAARELMGEELFALTGDRKKAKYDDTIAALENNPYEYALYVDGMLAGFAGWRESDGIGVVGLNAVDGGFHGHGYGLTLQKFITADMLAAGVDYAKVLTGGDDGHAPARRTYEKAGFCACLPSVTYYTLL